MSTRSKQKANRNPNKNFSQKSKSANELLLLNKDQLKSECRKRGQDSTGTKTQLLERLGHKMVGPTKKKDGVPQQNGDSIQNNVATRKQAEQKQKEKDKRDRESLVLWKRPLLTLEYFFRECFLLSTTYGRKILANRKLVVVVLISVLAFYILVNSKGPHQQVVQGTYRKLLWCLYWIGLGILSSVGLGTGLHTFLLYLGPHIAQVTLAAYECESLNFPEPPYPEDIVCPDERNPLSVSILSIMAKVRLEAMCWGAGTALGELPPYFMARAARLSGLDPDDDDNDLKELEELEKKKKNKDVLTLMERGKLFVEEIVQKVGFFGILACASIPNPLFDLAGITCGHFLVPFWTFFGATLIGKAVVKMHIQKLFVIVAFNETLIETAMGWLRRVPLLGGLLQTPFEAFLQGQKVKLHKGAAGEAHGGGGGGNVLGAVFEKFVIVMVLYFVVSIVNSFAQSYHKRVHEKKK